jgi:hypothetical protein
MIHKEQEVIVENFANLISTEGWKYLVSVIEDTIEELKKDLLVIPESVDYQKLGEERVRTAKLIEQLTRFINLPEQVVRLDKQYKKTSIKNYLDPYYNLPD